MDTQALELVGRHRLASELLLAGLEVAFPTRDRGVDLIAYVDIDPPGKDGRREPRAEAGRFIAKPIQLKAASLRSFGVWKKYEKFHDLILAFVWHLDGASAPETYALTYDVSVAVAATMGWTETASWRDAGAYTTTRPGARLREQLRRHRMSPEAWRAKIGSKPR